MQFLFVSLWLAAGLFPFYASAASLPEASLEMDASEGYARLVINFEGRTTLPEYDALITAGVLRISFPQGIDVSVDDVPDTLSDYVSIARRDPDGGALRFALKKPVNINTMEAGERLFIDMLPPNWEGLPPGLPEDVVAELAKRAEEALKRVQELERSGATFDPVASVDLAVGEHPTFTRFVFSWSGPFDSSFTRNGQDLKVVFDQEAELDVSRLRARLPNGVLAVRSGNDDGSTHFTMQVVPQADIRAFREGNTYVMDITPPRRAIKSAEQQAVAEALAIEPPVADEAKRSNEIVSLAPQKEMAASEQPEPSEEDELASKVILPAAKPNQSMDEVARPRAKTEGGEEAGKLKEVEEQQQVSPPTSSQQLSANTEPKTEGVVLAPKPLVLEPRSAVKPSKQAAAEAPVIVSQEPLKLPVSPEALNELEEQESNLVSVETRDVGAFVQVTFPFAGDVPTAFYRRDNIYTLVFESQKALDVRGMVAAVTRYAEDVKTQSHDDHQIVTMELKRAALASVEFLDQGWQLTLGETIAAPTKAVAVKRHIQGDGTPLLRIPFGDPSALHKIDDPYVGDTVFVVTALPPVRGAIKPQRFAELSVLRSSHGLALVPLADDLSVTLAGDDVLVERAKGLALSSGLLGERTIAGKEARDPTQPGLVEFATLTTPSDEAFLKRIREYERRSAMAEGDERTGLRMEMARFYIAHGFSSEAIGILELIERDAPDMASKPLYGLMMGAAQMMSNRPEEAIEFLTVPELMHSPDAAVWKTLAHVAKEHWPEANAALGRTAFVTNNYPVKVQSDFNLAAVKAQLSLGDYGSALKYLSQVEPSKLDVEQAARYDLLRGQLADISGRTQEALTAFDFVLKSTDGPWAAEAQFRSTHIRYRDGYIDREEAIDQLDGLVTSWRGDKTEINALRLLARLRAQQGDYQKAFEAMKQALYSDPEAEETRRLQEEMGSVYTSLFLDGKANELDTIRALSLFYDFRELLPVGSRGDKMVRNLANRLIDLDLLQQAASLLSHQIDNRLKGAAKAQVAADLAVVYLLDRKPEEALRALSRTRQGQLPRVLQRQRSIVEARALTESGRPDLALELVRNMSGSDVERLRADTMWAAEHWQDAGEQLERMHGSRWSDAAPLSKQERLDVLKAAVGYTLAEDRLGLERLRQKYAEKMSTSEHASAFNVVTRPIEERGVPFREVARAVTSTDSLQMFLQEYRRNYLSAPSASAAAEQLSSQTSS
ncbi:tetratricopeptide repeat protein [Pseudovibrio flavus]|uniref:tetratricopeptide repeat protein n=1 Tax=Pseudovibrio flavus TaxID=2529854 RepID=UPI00211B827C|nr:tetratricopeptide repeat protein [Pseudovibrio flavus]